MLDRRPFIQTREPSANVTTFQTILLILLVVDALALVGLVLLQQGKGADVGAAFGSGGANTLFGSAGSASFLTKATAWLAIGFFVISFGLAYTAKEQAKSLREFPVTDVTQSIADGEADEDEADTPAADETEDEKTAPDLPDV